MRSFFDSQFPLTSSRGAFAPEAPDYVEDVVLSADVLARVPIPAGARFVAFSFDGDVRGKFGGTSTALALPTATSADGGGSELNPAARRIPDAAPTHVCLRAPAACKGSLSFWS